MANAEGEVPMSIHAFVRPTNSEGVEAYAAAVAAEDAWEKALDQEDRVAAEEAELRWLTAMFTFHRVRTQAA